MIACPECGEELESIETRETLVYWSETSGRYCYAEPCFDNVYCPECGKSIGDNPEVKEVLKNAS